MSTAHGGEGQRDPDEPELAAEYQQWGLYGYLGHDTGEYALRVLDALLEPVPLERPRSQPFTWEECDKDAMNFLQQFDTGIWLLGPAPDPYLDGGDQADFYRAIGRFHAALPFGEPERHWLFKNMDLKEETHLGKAEEIMSGGLLRVVQGRDLVRRWWAWRRETDEFAGQGSLNAARAELIEIADTLILETNRDTLAADVDYDQIRNKLAAVLDESQ
jgi:hypothetical protein